MADRARLADAINHGFAHVGRSPPVEVAEDMLTFKCLRCGRTVGARQAVITQDASEVVYSCPHDGGRFATVHTQHGSVFSYDFSDAELAIRVQGSDVAWWDFVNGGGDDATTV